MASASTPSANEPAKDLILVHTVQLKLMLKAQISGRMVSSGISDVAIASMHSEKTRLKIAPVLAETLVTQRSPCYSAVSAIPLPDCSNYSPFCRTHCLILRIPFTTPIQIKCAQVLNVQLPLPF